MAVTLQEETKAEAWRGFHSGLWQNAFLRYVLVPGLTDDLEDIGHIASFAAGLGNVERVDVLPFHQMGRFKWAQLGIPYTLQDVKPPTNELVQRTLRGVPGGRP
jgi:pyruvate formate lyase activating enzyme